ncbi:glycosyltransferase family protein [Paracoccus onubensis]|nr:hypothetical protein [Paracoccus onubensis]
MMIAPSHELEWQALLLGATIRNYVKGEYNLYFCIEDTQLPQLAQSTRNFIRQLGGTIRTISNRGVFNPEYKIGNKVIASTLEYPEDRIVFLDSDTIFVRSVDISELCRGEIAVQEVFFPLWTRNVGQNGVWDQLYGRYSIDQDRLKRLRDRSGHTFPYFNAGLVSFDKKTGFAQEWLRISREIDADSTITQKRPWLDQIALSLAAMRVSDDTALVKNTINIRPRRRRAHDIVLAHYTNLVFLRSSGLARAADFAVRRVLKCRSFEHFLYQVLKGANEAGRTPDNKNYPFAKVMGERNTGTNLIESTIRRNFRARPLITSPEGATLRNLMNEITAGIPEHPLAWRDLLHEYSMDTQFGWKHARPDIPRFRKNANWDYTVFILTYKHPAFWLKSMFKRPYNPFQKQKAERLRDFMTRDFALTDRDCLPYDFIGTPLAIYQEKLRGYLELAQAAPERTLIFSYEDIIRKQESFLLALSGHFQQSREKLEFLSNAAKSEDRSTLTTADYVRKYSDKNIFAGFTSQDLAIYKQQIDDELFAQLAQVTVDLDKIPVAPDLPTGSMTLTPVPQAGNEAAPLEQPPRKFSLSSLWAASRK